jgi:DNA-binding NarL/FixJ family response regulator
MADEPSILHIEDNDAEHILFRHDLRKLHFHGHYMRAHDLDEAAQILDETKPAFIVINSKVGPREAAEVVHSLKEKPKARGVRIIVYSTAISPVQCQQALREGAACCVKKEVDSNESLDALRRALEPPHE